MSDELVLRLVRRSARRRGVVTRLLALTLVEARRLRLDWVLISCDLGNIGSAQGSNGQRSL